VSAKALTWLIFSATVAQLVVATFIPGLDQFEGKAFGARLLAYPLLMLVTPAIWWLTARRTTPPPSPPWSAFALIMAPFLVDVTGNTLDLYDSIGWWDDLNHFANWVLLGAGFGVLIARADIHSRWVFVLAVTGLGALLAIGWELGEWLTFIRHGTELDTAYEDTLGDEALGTLGGLVGALLVMGRTRVLTTDAV
jgi:hypothetical protein